MQKKEGRHSQHIVLLLHSCSEIGQEVQLAILGTGWVLQLGQAVNGKRCLWKLLLSAVNKKRSRLKGQRNLEIIVVCVAVLVADHEAN